MSKKYFVAAEIPATTTIENVTKCLQKAFDNGAAGHFQVLVTMAPTYLVVFERDAADDEEYVQTRIRQGAESVQLAVMQQIAAELEEGAVTQFAIPVKEVLQEGDAQCFDFGSGAITNMDLNLPDDLSPVTSSGGLKSVSDDDLCASCGQCQYRPGEMSGCQVSWPGLEDTDGYVQKCIQFIVAK